MVRYSTQVSSHNITELGGILSELVIYINNTLSTETLGLIFFTRSSVS